MIADRLRALAAELSASEIAEIRHIADRLEEIIAAYEGRWQPDLAGIIGPMLADGRTAGSGGVPRVGRQTRKKAEQIASAILTALASPPPQEPQP